MTKIVGHRGAAGLALENTIEAIHAGLKAGVHAIEFDVHATRDGQIVVCHDPHLARVSGSKAIIEELRYDELQKIELHNGQRMPLLREVLDAVGKTPIVIEIKVKGHTKEICDIVAEYPHLEVIFASFKRGVIKECHELLPDVPGLVGRNWNDLLELLQDAKAENATGIDLNYRMLNPLTYWLCKRANLQIMAYTVNNRLIGRLIQRLYPDVWICTNYPGKFIQGVDHARSIRPQRKAG